MKGDRFVGGLWCHQVLAKLSDYMDGEIAESGRERVEAHLRECDICERFGGDFAHEIRQIRTALHTPPSLEPEVAKRLQEKILHTDQ